MSRLRSRQPYTNRERANRPAGPKELPDDILVPYRKDQRPAPGVRDRIMYLHRPPAKQLELGATAMLAVVKSMPRDISVHPRNPRSLGVTMLDPLNNTRHKNFVSENSISSSKDYNPEALRRKINRRLPSFRRPLTEVSVGEVIQVGDPGTPILAIEVIDPRLDKEVDELNVVLASLRGASSVEIDVKPHISIASFPGLETIPLEIMEQVREDIPNQIDLAPGRFYTPEVIT